MRALSAAPCTDARLYTLRIKIVPEQQVPADTRIVELTSGDVSLPRQAYIISLRCFFSCHDGLLGD